MTVCPIHGPSGWYIYSPALLEPRADGTLPAVVIVEIKDTAEEEAFFRINVTPEEAAAIMDRLSEGCSRCFGDRRRAAG